MVKPALKTEGYTSWSTHSITNYYCGQRDNFEKGSKSKRASGGPPFKLIDASYFTALFPIFY